MLRALATCSCLLAFSSLGPAQNLVVNGNFRSPTIAPWTVQGFAFNPALEDFDVTGTGVSRCYAATPSKPDDHELSQSISLVSGVTYEVRVDVAVNYPIDYAPQLGIRVILEGDSDSFVLPIVFSNGVITQTRRVQRAALFSLATRGDVLLKVEFFNSSFAGAGSFRLFFDNLIVRPHRDPFIGAFRDARWIGFINTLPLSGAPGVPYFLFLSFDLANRPIVLPGITGEVYLGPTGLRLYRNDVFGMDGTDEQVINVPNNPSIFGVPIHWQALQFNQVLGLANLGWPNTQGFQ